MKKLGMDFGTSNTAAAYTDGGAVVRVSVDETFDTIPTAVFFDFSSGELSVGRTANSALFSGYEGRYMRSLKSVLGTSLMAEKRSIAGQRLDFYDIISQFIERVKSTSESQANTKFSHVVSGRPVFFHRNDEKKDGHRQDEVRV